MTLTAEPKPTTPDVDDPQTGPYELAEADDAVETAPRFPLHQITTETDTLPQRRRWGILLALLAITLAGGVIRFISLDQPSLWYDEAMTYSRVNGTYMQMIEVLRNDGFPPLHYTAYWLLAQVTYLTPWMMRVIPAVAGVLMIPVVFALARQFTSPGRALAVAGFTAANAFMLHHSRDAKMYMHFWLFFTLAITCLIWWARTGRRVGYLSWILGGVGAVGLHGSGLFLLVLAPIVFASIWPIRIKRALLLVVSMAIIGVGPWVYYTQFNKWTEHSGGIAPGLVQNGEGENGTMKWGRSGIGWVSKYNEGISIGEQTLNSASVFLTGLRWPRTNNDPPDTTKPALWVAEPLSPVLSIVLLLSAVGLLTWRRSASLDNDHSHAAAASLDGQPWARTAFQLGVWIILPMYGVFYCRSVPDFAAPWEWIGHVWDLLGHGWWVAVGLAIVLAFAMHRLVAVAWLAAAVTAGLALTTLVFGIAEGTTHWLAPALDLLTRPWMLMPLVACIGALIWHYSGSRHATRLRQLGKASVVGGLLFALCCAAYGLWTLIFALSQNHTPQVSWESIWMSRYQGFIWPAFAVVIVVSLLRLPTWWLRTAGLGVLLAASLTQGILRITLDTEPPTDRIARDVWAGQDQTSTTRTFLLLSYRDHATPPRYINDRSLFYNLCVEAKMSPSPRLFRRGGIRREFTLRKAIRYRMASQVRNNPHIERVIIWDAADHWYSSVSDRTIERGLGKGWQLVDTKEFIHRQHHTWRQGPTYRRRVYERQGPPNQQQHASSQHVPMHQVSMIASHDGSQ